MAIHNSSAPSGPVLAAPGRLLFLDGIRGWSAVIVLLYHLMVCFLGPTTPAYQHPALRFICDGKLAVYFFYVISGFALAVKFITRPGEFSAGEALFSRYLRLAIPVFVASLVAYAFLKTNLFCHLQAAAATRNPGWLDVFYRFDPSLKNAVVFSFYSVFFNHLMATSYNSSLWMMPVLFAGSAVLLISLGALMPLQRGGRVPLVVAGLVYCYCITRYPETACFFAGYLLAELHHSRFDESPVARIGAGAVLWLAVYAATFRPPEDGMIPALIAQAVVFGAVFWPPARSFLSLKLSYVLGRISYPLFLVQIIVICSFSCRLWMLLPHYGFGPLAVSNLVLVSSVLVCFTAAALLLPVEKFSLWASRRLAGMVFRWGFARV